MGAPAAPGPLPAPLLSWAERSRNKPRPAGQRPGPGRAVTRVSGKCRGARAGRQGCPHGRTHTRDTRPRLRDRPLSAQRSPRSPKGLSLPRGAVLGDGERSPRAPRAHLPAGPGSVRLGGSLGSAAAAAARAALHLFPRGRPGRRVRGAVGTFATLLAFHRRHVTPRHSTPLPPHSSGGRAFQGGKGREGLQHPPGPPAHGPPVPSGRPSAGPPHGEVTAAPRWALAGRGSAASSLLRRNGLG